MLPPVRFYAKNHRLPFDFLYCQITREIHQLFFCAATSTRSHTTATIIIQQFQIYPSHLASQIPHTVEWQSGEEKQKFLSLFHVQKLFRLVENHRARCFPSCLADIYELDGGGRQTARGFFIFNCSRPFSSDVDMSVESETTKEITAQRAIFSCHSCRLHVHVVHHPWNAVNTAEK